MAVIFLVNPHFWTELTEEAQAKAVCAAAATAAAEAAREVAGGFAKSGTYEDSLYADSNRYGSTDSAAGLIEWGSANNPPYAPLRKAAEMCGYRYVDDRKT